MDGKITRILCCRAVETIQQLVGLLVLKTLMSLDFYGAKQVACLLKQEMYFTQGTWNLLSSTYPELPGASLAESQPLTPHLLACLPAPTRSVFLPNGNEQHAFNKSSHTLTSGPRTQRGRLATC